MRIVFLRKKWPRNANMDHITTVVTPINDAFVKESTKCGEWPVRPGKPTEFGRFVAHIFENEMINGAVLRQDAALRGAISID